MGSTITERNVGRASLPWGTHRHCAYRSPILSDEEGTFQQPLECVSCWVVTRLPLPSHPEHTRGYISQAPWTLYEVTWLGSVHWKVSTLLSEMYWPLKPTIVLCALSLSSYMQKFKEGLQNPESSYSKWYHLGACQNYNYLDITLLASRSET